MVDTTNPVITIVSPIPDSLNNSNTSTIEAIIKDEVGGAGVSLTSITVTINGQYAVKEGVVQAGFVGSVVYTSPFVEAKVTITRNLAYQDLQSVNVSVSAQDLASNPASTRVFSFITEDNSGAIIINPTPARDSTQVAPTTEIFFNVRRLPRETDLLQSTLRVALTNLDKAVIDGETVFFRDEDGNPILDGYGNPLEALFVEPGVPPDQRQVSVIQDADGLGFSITIIPLFPLPLASVIGVSISIEDAAGNLTSEQYSFATIDDAAPFISDVSPAPNSLANSIATPVSFSVGDRVGSFLGSGVDLNTLDVSIDGDQAVVNGSMQPAFVGAIDFNSALNGYDVVLSRLSLFQPRKSINVDISASDISGNLLRTSFFFATEDVVPPTITFVYPQDQSVNIAQDATLVIDLNSEVAVEEIDINSIAVSIDGDTVLLNNSFSSSVIGSLSASAPKTLTITIRPKTLFGLGQVVSLAVSASDVFGNIVQRDIEFTTTTQLTLATTATPPGAIYSRNSSIPGFPSASLFGQVSFLDVVLTANRAGVDIYYTTDGTEPAIDAYGPLGSTQLYSTAIRLASTSGLKVLKYFAFDSVSSEQEEVKTSNYFFTDCPEDELWIREALRDGLEYTLTPVLIGSQYISSVITNKTQTPIGTANYQHDLGRISYVDELSFDISGMSHFRVRIADTMEQLRISPWINQLLHVTEGQHVTYFNGIETEIEVLAGITHVEGRKRTFGTFNDEAYARLNEHLGRSFAISTDMRLPININSVVGGKSFLRLRDDVFTLEVQQIVSKINASVGNTQLVDSSSLIGETPQVFINGNSVFDGYFDEGYAIIGSDGYLAATDGEKGFVSLFPPPTETFDTLRFSYTKVVPIASEYVLEDDTTGIHAVTSTSPSIYNTFQYYASERQRVVFSDVPSNGQFQLSLGSEITTNIGFGASAATVQAALNALPSLSTTTVTGDFLTGFDIKFGGDDGGVDQPLLEVVSNTLRINFTPIEVQIELVNQGGVTYSSAKTAVVYYKPFESQLGRAFAIGVADKPMDSTLSKVTSLNLDARIDQYVSAETNNIFKKTLLLEEGDYNFRFGIAYNTTQGLRTRLVGNPFVFKTRQNLSSVQAGDKLVVATLEGLFKYEIQAITLLISNEYVIEFQEQFPQTPTDIPVWSIERNNVIIITSSQKILVTNPLRATIGVDAEGAVGNIVLPARTEVTFEYISSSAIDVYLLGTFNDFNPVSDKMEEQFDQRPINRVFDRDLTLSYTNDHVNFHKIHIEPLIPTIVDRVRFYTGVDASEEQRTRLQLDGIAISKAEYLARRQDGTIAEYIPDGYEGGTELDDTLSTTLLGVPDIFITDTVLVDTPVTTFATDVYTSDQDGYVEWKYVQVGTNKNRDRRRTIDFLTRFDSYSGEQREHKELEIYSLPLVPQLIADFLAPAGSVSIQRLNKSEFAAPSNNVTIKYARSNILSHKPLSVESVIDNGIVDNFFRAVVEAPGSIPTQLFIDTPHIFTVGEQVVVYDALATTYVRTKVKMISTDNSGLIEFEDAVPSQGIVVKDYQIIEDENTFKATLEIPDFSIIFYATIFDFTASTETTEIIFENILDVDASLVLGGQLTYPLLLGAAKIIDARNESVIGGPDDPINTNYQLKQILVVTIDKPILITHEELGCIVEVFNSTKRVVDYEISKTDGEVIFKNESFLASGESTRFNYSYDPVPYQVPNQMWCFTVLNPTDQIEIRIEPTQYQISLKEIEKLTTTFFDGADSRAPAYVQFTVNDQYAAVRTFDQSTIIDGYNGDFDPSQLNTGNIREFSIPMADIVLLDGYDGYDGYGDELLTSLTIRFTGQTSYCLGEIEAIVFTELLNSQCRITLNEEELFRSPVAVGPFGRYKIQVEEGLILVFFNGALVLRRPLVLQDPIFEFGATGKSYDDLIKADFKNMIIDRFFTVSPAKIGRIGRYIEIEGTVIS